MAGREAAGRGMRFAPISRPGSRSSQRQHAAPPASAAAGPARARERPAPPPWGGRQARGKPAGKSAGDRGKMPDPRRRRASPVEDAEGAAPRLAAAIARRIASGGGPTGAAWLTLIKGRSAENSAPSNQRRASITGGGKVAAMLGFKSAMSVLAAIGLNILQSHVPREKDPRVL